MNRDDVLKALDTIVKVEGLDQVYIAHKPLERGDYWTHRCFLMSGMHPVFPLVEIESVLYEGRGHGLNSDATTIEVRTAHALYTADIDENGRREALHISKEDSDVILQGDDLWDCTNEICAKWEASTFPKDNVPETVVGLYDTLLFSNKTEVEIEAASVLESSLRPLIEGGSKRASVMYLMLAANACGEIRIAFDVGYGRRKVVDNSAMDEYEMEVWKTYSEIWEDSEMSDAMTQQRIYCLKHLRNANRQRECPSRLRTI